MYPWQSGYAVNNNNPIAFADPFGLEGGPGKGTKAREGTGYSANRGGVWTGEDVTLDEIEITAKAEGSFWKGVGGFLKSIVTQYSDNAKIVFNFKTLGYAIKGGLSYGITRSYVESELEKEVKLYQESGGFVGYAVQKVLSSPGLAENLLVLDLGKNLYQGNQEQAGYESAMLGWIVVDALLTKRGGGPKRPKMKVKFPTYFGGKWSKGTPRPKVNKPVLENTSLNQLVQKIKKRHKKVPKTIDQLHVGKSDLGELPHIHFTDGSALNINGTWKHITNKHGNMIRTGFSNAEKKFLKKHGWKLPK